MPEKTKRYDNPVEVMEMLRGRGHNLGHLIFPQFPELSLTNINEELVSVFLEGAVFAMGQVNREEAARRVQDFIQYAAATRRMTVTDAKDFAARIGLGGGVLESGGGRRRR